jgi:hypothetical protein
MSVLLALQPEIAAFVFDDAAGGTPQRFAWFAAVDPDPPEVDDLIDHPGPLAWMPPTFTDLERRAEMSVDNLRRVEMTVPRSVEIELRSRHRDTVMGKPADPLDSHAGLVQLKLAGLLAVLDNRVDITEDDWELARMVATNSRAVREWTRGRIAAEGRRHEYAANERAAERAERVEVGRLGGGAKVARVARVVGRHVHRHEGDEVCDHRCLHHAVRSTDRHLLDAAIGHAIQLDWIVDADGRYLPGESRPA